MFGLCLFKNTIRHRASLIFLFLLLLGLGDCETLESAGLSTKFSDMVLENLPAGIPYSIKERKKLPFVVFNNSENPTVVEITVQQPNSLAEGYEPIPDPGWIKVIPSVYNLGSRENTSSDIIILVPNEVQYKGRHFQAMIVSESKPEFSGGGGMAFTCAIATRVRFSVEVPGPQSIQAMKKHNALLELNFDLAPSRLNVKKIRLGEEYDLKKENRQVLKLVNRGAKTLKFKLSVDNILGSRARIAPDYELAPEHGWLRFKKDVIKVKPNRIQDVEMVFDIPDKEEYRNKKLGFIIKAELLDYSIPVEVESRVYVITGEESKANKD